MTPSGKGDFLQLGLATTVTLVFNIVFPFANSAFAESLIVPDQNLGTESSRVGTDPNNPLTEVITGGATRGSNLFHSFGEFNVKEGQSALFSSPNNQIQNILVRVTGSNRSEILGKLETSAGSTTNLFLINPNGIVFGQNATLQIGGSFIASTASGIKFTNENVFSATAPQTPPLLMVNVPLGLQFGGISREINLQGTLAVDRGKTLALVGGNVTLDGGNVNLLRNNLLAPNGQIALGGILGAGIIELNLDSNNHTQPLSFPHDATLADIWFINQARIDVSGDGGGNIQLQGKNITLNDASQVVADTLGNQIGRGIFVQAEQIKLQNGSQIKASVREQAKGDGGSIIVKATDLVQVSGEIPNGREKAGNPSALFTETYGEGSAGELTIETKRLIVENGANVAASAREGSQALGGKLAVNASEFVKLSGTSAVTGLPSGLFTQTYGTKDAGSLTINTRQLIVQYGAVVTAGTRLESQGNGGTLTVHASDFVKLSGTAPNNPQGTSGLFVRSRGSGDAGSLSVTTGQLIVQDRALLTVGALGSGNAGNLEIKAQDIRLDNQGQLIAETKSGNGGNITLQLQDLLLLRNNSKISTSAGIDISGGGNGGNITIDIPDGFIVAAPNENSDIRANAYTGSGGRVQINAFGIFGTKVSPIDNPLTSDITASSERGPQGTIEITTPDVEVRPELINLPNKPVDLKVSQVCQAGVAKSQNSFTITGRGGLPSSPIEPLNADAVLADWISIERVAENPSGVTVSKNPHNPTSVNIVEATGWKINSKGEVILTANASIATPHNSWQQPTNCGMSS